MTAKLLFVLSILFSSSAVAVSGVQITEVGLKGYYSTVTPTPVSIQVDVPQGVTSIQLDFVVTSGDSETLGPWRVDHFSKRLAVRSGERIQDVTPLQLPGSNHSKLELRVVDSAQHPIGTSTIDLSSLTQVDTQNLVLLFCEDHGRCDEAQSQISFGGSEDDVAEKNRKFKFVTLQTPRQHWWDYDAASFIVVAGPVSLWTPEQRFGLEAYARRGGRVVLLEKECGDGFLAPYRVGAANPAPLIIGRGKLYRVASLPSKELKVLFSGKKLKEATEGGEGSSADTLRGLVGVSFGFPRLRWLLIWLAVYILIVGAANFALLRRFRRLEWGWVSTTAIAVLFALGLYVASSANRPKHVTLDNIRLRWMDSRSPVVWESIGLRVSSPDRRRLTAIVGDHSTLDMQGVVRASTPDVDIATEITRARRLEPGWQVQIGPPIEIDLSLLRWSFTDLTLQTFQIASGTVTLDSNLHLKNGTGRRFREAMYLDFAENKKYFVTDVAEGQEIDLAKIPTAPIWVKVERESGQLRFESWELPAGSSSEKGPVALRDLPYKLQFARARRIFLGVSNDPAGEVRISASDVEQHNFVLTVVALDRP